MMDWGGTDKQVEQNMTAYGNAVVDVAIAGVASYFAPIWEAYAKENAPWTDQTANARQTLHAWWEKVAAEVVELYLSHGVYYGLYLETRFSGRYAIIWPTIEKFLPEIKSMLDGIFK